MKLLTKLTLTATISKVLILLLFIFLLPSLVERVAFESTNRQLRMQEKKVFDNIRDNGMEYYLQGDSSYGSYTLLKEEYISLEMVDRLLIPDSIFTSERIIEADTIAYRILNRGFEFNNNIYALEIGRSIASISQYNAPLQRIALYVLASLILLTLFLELGLTRVLLRPLGKIIRSKLINTKFPFKDKLVPVKTSTSDFKYLDESLIGLLQRINEDFEREREFTSNASHELMTPIGILQTKLENMMLNDELGEHAQTRVLEMMKTLNRLKRIVDSLLLISRIENDQYARQGIVNPSRIVNDIVEELAHRMEMKMIATDIELSKETEIPGMNADLISQLFYNIITNAIRYNKEGGMIRISDKQENDGSYSVFVEDSGPGIAPEDREIIFSRFRKKGTSQESYGLGLAIVKSIADYHGITVQVGSSMPGGSVFIVRFPETKK